MGTFKSNNEVLVYIIDNKLFSGKYKGFVKLYCIKNPPLS